MELDRYHRQMLLPGFGEEGQRRLLGSTVLVVGCGALGTHIADMLARAGAGHLVIVDRDFIEITNLQRQVLFDEGDIEEGLPKAEAARRKLERINSDVTVTPVVDDVNHGNIERFVTETAGRTVDLIVDGLDNFETRFLLNDVAVKHGVPYVYGGAVGTAGMSYAILPHTGAGDTPWEQAGAATPCLRCIFEQAPPPGMNPTCDTSGVLGPVVSIVANYEVAEALKILLGRFEAVCPTLQSIDPWENSFRQLKVARAYEVSDCKCCHHGDFEFLAGKFASGATTLCGRNAVQLTHQQDGERLEFDQVAERLRPHGNVQANKFMVRAAIREGEEDYELTLFTDGRAIVKGTTDASVAKGLYAKYVGS